MYMFACGWQDTHVCPTVENLGAVPVGYACCPTVGLSATYNALEATVENSHIHAIMLTYVLIRVQTVSPTPQDVLDPQLDSGAEVPDS